MGRITLVTGGRRSGKSGYAQRYAESLEGPRTYIATCPVIDDETAARVEAHKKNRINKGWVTIEETVDLAGAILKATPGGALLIECVTLWLSNLMYKAESQEEDFAESHAIRLTREALAACRRLDSTVIFVTNEIGWGVIPDNRVARKFSDIAGKVNQLIASESDTAILIVSGYPVQLK
ncbi:Adenosylcobinamide kinase / Adenosylcobinamide-phosphate guanylyltransferase [hydrothermal vent metagenome]|uniref:Adenosylcobinamide kinase n=1 Tax=hydrothermal vent metagenome TaxID=652676 RepID=A0A3B1CPF6_9ZZZZ